MDPTFFFQLLIAGILLGGIYALASIGLTLIFGVMKIVNFAHGEFLMIAMYLSFWLFHYLHIDPYLSTLLLVPIMFLVGILTYYLFIKPTLNASALCQIFITLGFHNHSKCSSSLLSVDFRTSPELCYRFHHLWALSLSSVVMMVNPVPQLRSF
jgi:branched-chain amino acid transport system permease protein